LTIRKKMSVFVEEQRCRRRRGVTRSKNAVEIDYYVLGENLVVLEVWNKRMEADTSGRVR